MPMYHARMRVLVLILAAAWCGSASGLQITKTRWGFNERVVPSRFNLLSLEIYNDGGEPFDGALTLTRRVFGGNRVGARLVRQCYITAGQSRWVQFHPYVRYQDQGWVLSWDTGELEIKAPGKGAPARVQLLEADALAGPGLRRFDDHLFPASVIATSGLHSVVLDYQPDWPQAKRVVFMDWLKAGGIVHLAPGSDGEIPTFDRELAPLNNPVEVFRIGAGEVFRHVAVEEVSENWLIRNGYSKPRLDQTRNSWYDAESIFAQGLRAMHEPDHSWALIFLLAFMYLILIGPASYIVARRRRYEVSLALCFGLVVVFAILFSLVGKRGYGEETSVHTVSYARAVDDTRYDVTQWSELFVTSGDTYRISHPAAAPHLYATTTIEEAVRGEISTGVGGGFEVDVPLFSARGFVHRSVLTGHDTRVTVRSWRNDKQGLAGLSLVAAKEFPQFVEAWVLHRGLFYAVQRIGDELRIVGRATPREKFFADLHYYHREYDKKEVRRRFRKLLRVVIAQAVGGTRELSFTMTDATPPDDRLELFVFAASPKSFEVDTGVDSTQYGYVLYHRRVWQPKE